MTNYKEMQAEDFDAMLERYWDNLYKAYSRRDIKEAIKNAMIISRIWKRYEKETTIQA